MNKGKDRDAFQRIKEKSEDDFEKLLTYISAGALGLSITFIEKLVPLDSAANLTYLIIGWILLALTLVVNLFSHSFSSSMNEKSLEDYDNEVEGLHDIITKRNKRIDIINWTSLGLLAFGLGFTIYFTSLNALNMAKQNDRTSKPSKENYEEKGRKIPQPRKTEPPKKKTDG
jgi:hypothetical protein